LMRGGSEIEDGNEVGGEKTCLKMSCVTGGSN
jgi:hypothetical protein